MKKTFLLLPCLAFAAFFFIHTAQADLSGLDLELNAHATTTRNVATAITGVTITGSTTSTVPVRLFVSNGTLAMTSTTGITFNGASSGSSIYFSGTLANVNNALSTLTYSRSTTGTDTLEISLVEEGEVFFPDNGHLYKFITGTITGDTALSQATGLEMYGASGYLATITSADENDFVAERLEGDGWMSARDSISEGDWKWSAGPESGLSFWSGTFTGGPVSGRYSNWSSSEPNDFGTGEDCAQFYVTTGMWNDYPCSMSLSGYVAEFGAPGDLPTVIADTLSITTVAAPALNSVSPADNATGVRPTSTLVLTFSETVTGDAAGEVTIYNALTHSVFETFAVNVSPTPFSGLGTSVVTIDPYTDFESGASYYVFIDNTIFVDTDSLYYAGISSSSTWNFTVADIVPPTITNVFSDKANGHYTTSTVIDVDVTFSEPVTSTGSVTVTLETGTTDRTCTFTVTNSTTATCSYTVQAGDTSSDLTVLSIAGTIRDGAANAMVDFAPATNLAANKNIVVDTTAPVITAVRAIPSRVKITDAIYYFSTSTEVSLQPSITNCGGDAESVFDLEEGTVSFNDLVNGTTYSCDFLVEDAAGNDSNTLTIGPFTLTNAGGSSMNRGSIKRPSATSTQPTTDSDGNLTGEPATPVVPPTTTSTVPVVIPSGNLSCTENLSVTKPIRMGAANDPAQVVLLEKFLNTYERAGLPVNGIYEQADFAAVVQWQETYATDILVPWGLTNGTGYVFTTSLKKIAQIHAQHCATTVVAPPVQTISTTCLVTDTTLGEGDSGALVTTAQNLLAKLKLFNQTATGYFGPVTRASVVAFQAANTIPQVGYIGPQTRAALNSQACSN